MPQDIDDNSDHGPFELSPENIEIEKKLDALISKARENLSINNIGEIEKIINRCRHDALRYGPLVADPWNQLHCWILGISYASNLLGNDLVHWVASKAALYEADEKQALHEQQVRHASRRFKESTNINLRIKEVASYTTSDGKVHTDYEVACKHEARIIFRAMFYDEFGSLAVEPDEVLDWIGKKQEIIFNLLRTMNGRM